MSRSIKSTCALLATFMVALAACGGSSDSQGRTRNAAIGEDAPELCIDSSRTSLAADGNLSIAFCEWASWFGLAVKEDGKYTYYEPIEAGIGVLPNITVPVGESKTLVLSIGNKSESQYIEEELTVTATGATNSQTPNDALTCATGGTCVTGDVGPGGGVVFYVADKAQDWGQYLESAPSSWNNTPTDPKVRYECPDDIETRSEIGAGKLNTEHIATACPTSELVIKLASFNAGANLGWFVPSYNEMQTLRKYVADYPNPSIAVVRHADGYVSTEDENWYLTSTETNSDRDSNEFNSIHAVQLLGTFSGSYIPELNFSIPHFVRPIRAFGPSAVATSAGNGDSQIVYSFSAKRNGADQNITQEVPSDNPDAMSGTILGNNPDGQSNPETESAPTMKTPINLAAERKAGSDGKPTVIFSWAYDRPADEIKDFYVQVNVSAPGPMSETQGIFQPGFGSGEGSTSLGLEGTPYDVSMFKEDLAYEITFIERWVNNPRRMSEPSAPLLLVLNPSTPPSPPPVVREDVTKCTADNVVVTLTPSEGSRITTTDDVTLTLQSPCLTLEASDLKVALEFTNANEHLYQCSKQKESEPRSCLALDGSDKVSFTTKLPAGEYQAVASLNAVFDYGKDNAGTYSYVIPKRLTVEQTSSGADNLCNTSKLVVKDSFVTHTCSSKWRVGLDVLRDGDNPRRIWNRRESDYREQLSFEDIGPGFNVIAMTIQRERRRTSHVSLMPFCYSKCETKKSAGPLKVIVGDTSVSAEMLKANASDCQGRIEDSWQIWLLNTTNASPWPSTVTQEFSTSETDGTISVDLTSFDQLARKQMSSFAMGTRLCWMDGVSNALATAFIDFQPLDPGSNVTGPSGEQADGQSPSPDAAADGSNDPEVTKVSVDQVLDPRSTVPVLVSNETKKIEVTPDSILGPTSVSDLTSIEIQKEDGTWEFINFAGGTVIPMSSDVTRSTFRVSYKDRKEPQIFTKTFVREDQAAMVSVLNVVENGKVTVTEANLPTTASADAGGKSSPSLWMIMLIIVVLLAFGTLVIRRVVIKKRDMGLPS